jgi:hypothetical protein
LIKNHLGKKKERKKEKKRKEGRRKKDKKDEKRERIMYLQETGGNSRPSDPFTANLRGRVNLW